MNNIRFRAFDAMDRDWLVEQHSKLYARDEGFDSSFGHLVGRIVDDFIATQDPDCEAGWIAVQGERRLGSIFCVRVDDRVAKLRLFLLVPQARGQGIGRQLLQHCVGFAAGCGYAEMQLWTHKSHVAAGALYRAMGWKIALETPVHSFGRENVEQHWSLNLKEHSGKSGAE